jgi:hypothetical protein
MIEDFEKPGDEFYLLKLTSTNEKNELGFAKEEYQIVKQIRGTIQGSQDLEIAEKGSESEALYDGYFCPTFHINTHELNNYRIKFKNIYETIIYKIKRYDPNLDLQWEDHIQLKLIRDKK